MQDRVTKVFEVGGHTVRVSKVLERRWTFTIDDGEVSKTFPTAAAAWTAGVRAAYQLDGSLPT